MRNVEKTSQKVDKVADVMETAATEGVAPVVNGVVSLVGKAAGYISSMLSEKESQKSKQHHDKK